MTSSSFAKQRSLARRRAMQALYQWQMTGHDLRDIDSQFRTEQDMSKVDVDYFHELLHGVPKIVDELDAIIEPYMDRTMQEVDPVERAILRLAAYELQQRIEIPYRVVINEAIVLAKAFGSDNSHTFVNGVLDKAARQVRQAEIK